MEIFILFLLIGLCVYALLSSPIYTLSCILKVIALLVLGIVTIFCLLLGLIYLAEMVA